MADVYPSGSDPESTGGGSGTFEEFYTATSDNLLKKVLRMTAGDLHLANDAMQDAYIVMFNCWSERKRCSLDVNRNYVIGITAHKVVDWYRNQRKHIEMDDQFDPLVDDRELAKLVDEMGIMSAVRKLISIQPPRRRAVAVLYFIESFTYGEIAAALRITESTVRTHIERMRAILKPYVNRIIEKDTGEGGDDE
jgi:RNA polymerase sigma factor (sigma-70 family)